MEGIIKNKFEKGPIKTETLTPQQLEKIILEEDRDNVKDKRFLSEEEGGVFHYFRQEDIRTEDYFPIVKKDNLIIGIAALQKSPFVEKLFWMKSISIDPEYQGNHYGTKLVEEINRFTKEQGYKLEVSKYSNKNVKDKLERLFNNFAEKYRVILVTEK